MADIDIPYYGRVAVEGLPYFKGCKEVELQIRSSKFFSDDDSSVETIVEIKCQYFRKCSRIRDKIREENNL